MNPSSIVSARSAAASTFGNGRATMPSQDESVWARLDGNYEKFQEARREHCLHRGGSLCCVGCGRVDRDGEKGWRAYRTVDDQVATYCPECAEAEFGDG